MTLWAKFKELVDRVAGEDQLARNLGEEELRLAAAAQLVRASVIEDIATSAYNVGVA